MLPYIEAQKYHISDNEFSSQIQTGLFIPVSRHESGVVVDPDMYYTAQPPAQAVTDRLQIRFNSGSVASSNGGLGSWDISLQDWALCEECS